MGHLVWQYYAGLTLSFVVDSAVAQGAAMGIDTLIAGILVLVCMMVLSR